MTQKTQLYINKSGTYCLRLRAQGRDRKISLHTTDLNSAKIAQNLSNFELLNMKIDPNKIKAWTLETRPDGSFKIETDNTAEDRASAIAAVEIMAQSLPSRAQLKKQKEEELKPERTISLRTAISEYMIFLSKSETALKSQRMAESTLIGLTNKLGANFDMSQICDDVIEIKWLEPRISEVAKTTAKRDLSFVRSFIAWAADRKRKYTPHPLNLSLTATGENWAYFTKSDLNLIFNDLHKLVENSWQLWIPLIGLYTGARISEIASIKIEYFSVKNGINALLFEGTKTDASRRTVPIHPDLIKLGILDFVKSRPVGATWLFDITSHNQNGAGATVSKWFTKYKRKVGLSHKLKVFHSFRPTIVDHLKQSGSGFEARCQFVGHDAGGGVHNKIYGRNELSLTLIKSEVVDKINWKTYCNFELNFEELQAKAKEFI